MDLSDPSAFASAYDEHARGVYGVALRVLGSAAQAQDVTQDVFLRVWRNPGRYDARRGDLGAYLRLMARSRAVDLYREAQAASRATDRLRGGTSAVEGEAPPEAVLRGADREAGRAAPRPPPGAQREALVLAYWGGLSAQQIARRSNVPVGTAKSRIRLGLARLREAAA